MTTLVFPLDTKPEMVSPNSQCLLLVDSPSALDGVSGYKIQTAIDAFLSCGTAVVVSAHRLSTVVNSDETVVVVVVVVDKDRVFERGTHKFLFKPSNSLLCNLFYAGL